MVVVNSTTTIENISSSSKKNKISKSKKCHVSTVNVSSQADECVAVTTVCTQTFTVSKVNSVNF